MFFRRAFLHSPIRYIVSFVISLGFAAIYITIQNKGWQHIICYHYGLMTGGFVCFLFGGLVLVEYFDAFNMFGYGFAKMFGNRPGYVDLIDYNQRKEEKRQKRGIYPFFPYFVVGVFVFLVGLFLGIF